jgi:Xaa-Pro aminopeptidase
MQQIIHDAFLQRIFKLQKKFPACLIDGILLTGISNIRYLSGFTGSEGVLILNAGEACLLVDGRYKTQAEAEVYGVSVLRYDHKMQCIEKTVKKMGLAKLGFEPAFINVDMYDDLKRRLKNVRLVPLGEELKALRACKDRREIAIMQKAAAIASGAAAALARDMKPGWTEREAALHLEMTARRAGAEQVAFETIVASGENAALPHAKPSNRKIRHGDFVVVDFGVKYQGYCSDETCTFAIGELTGDQKNAYRAVKCAHDEAIAAVRADAAAAGIDALARRVLGKKYGRYFVHGTGHGVGLEVHEAPRLAQTSPDVLKAGMVVTVEPGLYYPGRWGIRIEDTVVVKKNGCDIMTRMKKDIIIIE